MYHRARKGAVLALIVPHLALAAIVAYGWIIRRSHT
jgi:hypothetical protein